VGFLDNTLYLLNNHIHIMSSKSLYLNHINKLQNNFVNGGIINVLFCDVQDKYIPNIYLYKDVINVAENMAEVSKILKLNQIVTEHKKEAFGTTIPEIKKHFYDKTTLFEKTRFVMLDSNLIQVQSPEAVYVLLGIEAHVCITQTTIELLRHNKSVFILSDGVSSVTPGDRAIALQNLRSLGAYITTFQSLLFLLMQDAKHPSFKTLLPILKKSATKEGILFNPNLI
jgi:isochorismate hydrolase